jgi:hypothetical protein
VPLVRLVERGHPKSVPDFTNRFLWGITPHKAMRTRQVRAKEAP